MNIEQLEQIAESSAENLKTLIGEMSDDIQEAAAAAFEQAQADDKEVVKITLSHSIELDLGKNLQKDSLSFSVKHKESVGAVIPDPNQPEFEIDA